MRFWRDSISSGSSRDHSAAGGPPHGQVRVLVVGDSGVGKTSLVHLISNGSSLSRPPQTIGCTVSVKHLTYSNANGATSSSTSSNSIKPHSDSVRHFFVELWDVAGHDRYKDSRSLFYRQINGVIFIHDLTQRKTKSNLSKWAAEISSAGTFSAPLESGGPGGLPVPYLVIANKADIVPKEGARVSSGNLVDVARQWVEKQGLLPSSSSEELPLTESFPGSSGLLAAAKEGRYDKEAINKFFRMLIRKRYFSDELPAPNQWSFSPPHQSNQSIEATIEDDQFQKKLSFSGESHKYNMAAPLPAQRNLTPPPSFYPQQPVSVFSDNIPNNRSYQRLYSPTSGRPDIGSAATRTNRADINV
ncbi:Ras-related small GTP-binding family protein [Rhynchospora pubera]|uniref:Ras-related small GTP-binding family protein n=1 Tax=Rhynchospora pubera TaxID=906938 RepID=A0AAV8EUH8_9POAL|nr:Ras-related small GTP-binding family protein [Rhynchospora pubera]